MTLRLTEEEDRKLAELAAAEGRSKQEVVRSALAERWARQQREQQLVQALDQCSRATGLAGPPRPGVINYEPVTVYLDVSDLLLLAAAVTDQDLKLRDGGLLAAAAYRPRAEVLGVPAYETLWLKSAALLDTIVRTRPLHEGNWRLGWVAAVTCTISTGGGSKPTTGRRCCWSGKWGGTSSSQVADCLQNWSKPKANDVCLATTPGADHPPMTPCGRVLD